VFVRNNKPRKNLIEKFVDVSMLGSHVKPAEALYLFEFRDHLERVYHDACGGGGKELTRDAFVEFLKGIQGEEVATLPTKEKYTRHDFLGEWIVKYGLGALRDLRPDEKDLSKPISDYFISSSHNTYLAGNQLFSENSSKLYRKVCARII
jgi:phosphatidylinositol phospholipase C delta